MQNSKSEFMKEQLKEELKKRIKQLILNLIQFIDSVTNNTTCKIIAGQSNRSGMNLMAYTNGTRMRVNIFVSNILTLKGKI